MRSIGPSFFILGLVMASAIAQRPTTDANKLSSSAENDRSITNSMLSTMEMMTMPRTSNSLTTAEGASMAPMNQTQTTEGGMISTTSTYAMSSAQPETPGPVPTTQTRRTTIQKMTTAKPKSSKGDRIGIIILVVMILGFLVLGGACYFTRKRSRRYSVDLHSRPDDAQIPLSTVEPEVPADTTPQNGMQTFVSAEPDTKETQEPAAKPEAQDEPKAEPDKPAVAADPSADPAAAAPTPDSSADKAKEDAAEPTPAAPVVLNLEEKTDDNSSTVSNKTSEESLKETNENNSNNAAKAWTAARDWNPGNFFFDIPLNSPV